MGRACYPNLPNHKLNTLCEYLQINLNHHNAGSDSHACAELLLDYMRRGLKADRFLRQYDMVRRHTLRPISKTQPSETTKQLLKLKEILDEITADNELSPDEVISLRD